MRQQLSTSFCRALIAACALAMPSLALAQLPAVSVAPASEEIEPRLIGVTGTTTVGVSGFVDRFQSSEQRFPLNYTVHLDLSRFVTRHIAVIGGLTGSGHVGGEDDDAAPTGLGAPALHAFGGALYYFTPGSLASLYAGPTYWQQLTVRNGADRGAVVGLVGAQAVISSRAALFVEAGYGVNLTRGSEDDMRTRMLGRVGVRLKF